MDQKNRQNHFNNPIVNILLVALVFVGGYFLLSKNQNTPIQVQPQSNSSGSQQAEIDALKKTVEDLKNQKPSATPLSGENLQSVVKHWHPIVVYILCTFNKTDGSVWYQSGSGVLSKTNNTTDGMVALKVITNRHVLTDASGGPNQCSVVVPFDKTYTVNNAVASEITARDDVDLGGIIIRNPDEYLKNLPLLQTSGIYGCTKTPDLGSSIAILGYPAIGSQTDITVTQGIISAYEDKYYVTDAKIEHGNSGGAAIDIKNNCYLGIPTWVETGTVESLGRILKWQAF